MVEFFVFLQKNNMDKFRSGDKVYLKSDDRNLIPMTVNFYLKDTTLGEYTIQSGIASDLEEKMIECVWRDKNSALHKENFHEDALVLDDN